MGAPPIVGGRVIRHLRMVGILWLIYSALHLLQALVDPGVLDGRPPWLDKLDLRATAAIRGIRYFDSAIVQPGAPDWAYSLGASGFTRVRFGRDEDHEEPDEKAEMFGLQNELLARWRRHAADDERRGQQ